MKVAVLTVVLQMTIRFLRTMEPFSSGVCEELEEYIFNLIHDHCMKVD
jgi:hypothetical protein